MKIWVVGVSNCEGQRIVAICATEELAKKKLFKERDKLITEWREKEEWSKERHLDDVYSRMIKNLSGNDYDKWDNYPHECPYLYETNLLEK